jgi:mono/diheme cytochrome c family protein
MLRSQVVAPAHLAASHTPFQHHQPLRKCDNTSVKLLALLLPILLLALPAYAASKQDELAGATLFRDRGCAVCHGDHLQGTDRAPALDKVRKKLKADRIRAQITKGSVKMPAFGEILTPSQIDQLVAYLRSKHRPVPPPAPAAEPAPSANPQ